MSGACDYAAADPTGDNMLGYNSAVSWGEALEYHATDGAGYLTNISSKTLLVGLRWFASGWSRLLPGRPKVQMAFTSDVTNPKFEFNDRVQSGHGEKGYAWLIGGIFPPGASVKMSMDGRLDDGEVATFQVVWDEDFSSPPLVLPRPPRDLPDTFEDFIPDPGMPRPYVAKWNGTSSTADRLAAGSALSDIPGVTYNPDSGVITNYGGDFGYVLVMYQLETGYGGMFSFIRAGLSDGRLNSIENDATKCNMWIEFDANKSGSTDFLLMLPNGIPSYCCIIFFPGSYSERQRS